MIITAENLSKSYRSVKALDQVNICCDAKEICGLVGANGAGKTTLFKILLGLVTPDSGRVKIITSKKKAVGGIIDKPALYEYLNASENLKVFARIQGASFDDASITKALHVVGLSNDRRDPVKNFSMGMKQRLGIAIALLNNPKCLILDEPFSGLDPMGIASLRELISNLAETQGLAILISSHIVEELSKICNRLYVINNGKMVRFGPMEIVLAKNTVSYVIRASNLSDSKVLSLYNAQLKGNRAKVQISSEEISKLLKNLIDEGIKVNSCTPEIPLQQLFEATE